MENTLEEFSLQKIVKWPLKVEFELVRLEAGNCRPVKLPPSTSVEYSLQSLWSSFCGLILDFLLSLWGGLGGVLESR
jgi:hypothetical protein